MSRVWWAVWRRERQVWSGFRLSLLINLAGLALSVLPFFYIGSLFGARLPAALQAEGLKGGYFAYVLVGLAFSHFLRSGLAAMAVQLQTEQNQGTLETLVASPTPLPVILSATAAALFVADCGFALTYLLVGAWLGAPMQAGLAGAAALGLTALAAGILFSGWGMAAAGILLVVRRGNPLLWLGAMAFEVFGGVYCPIALLGEPWATVGRWLPFSHVIALARASLGLGPWGIWDVISVGVWAVVSLVGGLLVLRLGVERARDMGRLQTR
ncbi:MAG: ABC transporter permease [Candidatus Sericytochromatia bacterium]|nr:ABC transporter permease [Candidatus Sericytochromatia bacterium]